VPYLGRVPRPLSPQDGARVPYLVTFRWSEAPGATGYVIQVAGEESFSAPLLVDDTVVEPAFEVALPVIGPLLVQPALIGNFTAAIWQCPGALWQPSTPIPQTHQ
jgi:hypothetical protein